MTLFTRIARYLLVLVALVLAILYAMSARAPDPEIWHQAKLDEEFDRSKLDEVADFRGYLALEDRLFQQLQDLVYEKTPRGPDHRFERYSRGSAADATSRPVNWNRSFLLDAAQPVGGVLLLHGMSDSPYSLRAIGRALNARGFLVLGLRLPGHGTAPSGLLRVQWQDMAAATRLAMEHLAQALPGQPIHIVGYSTGAGLALDYTLNAETEPALAKPASLVMLSPAIGISPAAALAKWNRRLSYLPGLGHLAWLDMIPEFDPYKYNSFTTNAGEQVYLLTGSVAARIGARASQDPAPPPLPPMLVLKSTVDATTSTIAVVDRLLAHLNAGRHEYVLFDINRQAANASLLVSDPGPVTEQLLNNADLPFSLTVVGNENPESVSVVARTKAPFSKEIESEVALDAAWPPATLSLSHIALPFPPNDPLYGREHPGIENQVFLGHITIQGERGLLRFSPDWLIRLRHNPFYDYSLQRITGWIEAASH